MDGQQLKQEINTLWERNRNKFNAHVNWDSVRLSMKRLGQIVEILGGKAVSKICENYCKDYKYWNHGMPDLILWSTQLGIVKFSEVKSESDRLSEVQIAWLNFFN